MTELRPLLDSTDDELERALLQSVRADMPGGLGLRDAALALGLAGSTAEALAASLNAAGPLSHAAAPVASTVARAATSATTSTVASSGSVVSALGATSLGVIGKSLLGGALASFVALTTLDHSLGSSTSEPAAPVAQAHGAPAAAPGLDTALAPPPTVVPDVQPVPSAMPAPASAAGHPSVARLEPDAPVAPIHAPSNATFALPARPEQPAGAPPNASLAAEIRLLDQTRAALAQGDSTRAASLLARYAANRPSAVLAQEAALLRVRLLLNQGDRATAAQLARRIILEHPESAHVDSLRTLAAEP